MTWVADFMVLFAARGFRDTGCFAFAPSKAFVLLFRAGATAFFTDAFFAASFVDVAFLPAAFFEAVLLERTALPAFALEVDAGFEVVAIRNFVRSFEKRASAAWPT